MRCVSFGWAVLVAVTAPPNGLGEPTAGGWRDLLGDEPFAAFRPVKRPWLSASDARLRPGNDRQLVGSAGKGVILNGETGIVDNLLTRESFGDIEIEFEFMTAKRSNSGIKFNAIYEIQIFDSHGKKVADATDCGGIYPRAELTPRYHHIDKGIPPVSNAAKPPGEWQTLAIHFQAPRFDAAGKKTRDAHFVHVTLNGVVVHKDVALPYGTGNNWRAKEKPTGPLLLQGDHGPVAIRNARVRVPAATVASAP